MSTTTPISPTDSSKKRDRTTAEISDTQDETSSKRVRKPSTLNEDFVVNTKDSSTNTTTTDPNTATKDAQPTTQTTNIPSQTTTSTTNTPSQTVTSQPAQQPSQQTSQQQPSQQNGKKKNVKSALLEKLKTGLSKASSLLNKVGAPEMTSVVNNEQKSEKKKPGRKPGSGRGTKKSNGTSSRGRARGRGRGRPPSVNRQSTSDNDYEPQERLSTRRKLEERRPTRKRTKREEFDISELPEPMQKCYNVLSIVKAHKWSWPFLQPVDAVSLNIPDYYEIIKNPMDLGTVTKKLTTGQYRTVSDFAEDVRLIWRNCYTYNPPGSDVVKMAEVLSNLFEEKFKKIAPLEEREDRTRTDEITSMKQQIETLQKKLEQFQQPIKQEEQSVQKAPPKVPKQPTRPKRKTTPVLDARPMTFEEKKRLSEIIGTLDSDKLAKVVEIIQSRAPKASSQSTSDSTEIEVDLDKLDAVTLRQLEKFVKTCNQTKRRGRRSTKKQSPKENVQIEQVQLETKKDSEETESSSGESDSGSDSSDSSDSDSSSESDSEDKKTVDPSAPKPLSAVV